MVANVNAKAPPTFNPRVNYEFSLVEEDRWLVTKTFAEDYFLPGVGPAKHIWASRVIGTVSGATKRKMEASQHG